MTLRDLILRLRALANPRRVERELDEELAFHIERETQKHLADGVSPSTARTRALARFGSMPLVADQCRDARGTALVDALIRDILYAFRTFRRAPLAALTIVATVGLGLGMVSVVFTLYDTIYLRTDAVRNPHELFAVKRSAGPGANASLPFARREYEAMRREAGVFSDVAAILRPVPARIEGRRVTSDLVTGNFFQMLGVQPLLGRPLMADDDKPLARRQVIVLSHRGWNKLFAGDPAVIGRTVRVNGVPYEIVGVMPEGFRGLGILPPDYWAPLTLVGQFRDTFKGKEDDVPIDAVGRLKSGMVLQTATAALNVWASGQPDLKIPGRPTSIRLTPSAGTLLADVETLVTFSPLFFAFGLILMIGCANVANLLLARGISRQREIGVRLSLGASRPRIVRQLLTESLLLALGAAGTGLVVARLFLESALYAATTLLPRVLDVDVTRWTPNSDWRVLLFVVVGAIVSTALFGLAPALQATRLELVRTMRGEVTRGARPGRARHVLIAVQVSASALLLICAAVFLRGAIVAATTDPGVRTSDTVVVSIANEPRRIELLRAVTAHPSVSALAASSQPTSVIGETFLSAGTRADIGAERSTSVSVDRMAVSPEYFGVLGIDVVTGRGFTPLEQSAEAGVVVVSETAAHRLWPNKNPVGQMLRLHAPPSDESNPLVRTFTVIGVARDVGGGLQIPDLFGFRGVYLPTSPESAGTSLTLRVRDDPEQARLALLERLTSVDPGLGTINTMRTIAALQTYVMGIAFWLTVILGGLALVLTLSGLFSVLSYVVEQRAKEIGVRMALGATTTHVARLVLSQSLSPVGIGLVAGVAFAAALATLLMATPAASAIGGVVHVFDPAAYAASLLVIVTSCLLAASIPAVRAARIDPIATLRKD